MLASWALAVSTATQGLDIDATVHSINALQALCIREGASRRAINTEAVTASVRDVLRISETSDETIAKMLATLAAVSVREGFKGGEIDNAMLRRHAVEIVTLMLSDRHG
jgi:hypothetical protein